MIILKHNVLSVEDLFSIERQLLRWLDYKESNVGIDFNVLDLGRADIYGHLLGVFTRLGCIDTLNITHSDLLDFFIDVDSAYLNAPYHSFYHAVDIVLMIYYMLTDLDAKSYIPASDITALLIAALCHDIGHPGYNNVYQVNLATDLAKKYDNASVLEALSSEMTRTLILNKHVNIVNTLVSEEARETWMGKIEAMIMHTDMIHHYSLQEQAGLLEEVLCKSRCHESCHSSSSSTFGNGDDLDYFSRFESHPPPPYTTFTTSALTDYQGANSCNGGFTFSPQCYYPATPDDCTSTTTLAATHHITASTASTNFHHGNDKPQLDDQQCQQLSSILLHAADISNTVRPWSISKQWSDLIVQEFFRQGDIEKQHGLPVSPGMDRELSTQPDISLTFGDLVVRPYFEALATLLPGAHLFLDALDNNRSEWVRIKQSLGYTDGDTDDDDGHGDEDDMGGLLYSMQQRQFPTSLLPIPEASLLPHTERRVSVAAGTLVIPENVGYLTNGSVRCRTGPRSLSFAVERTSLSRKLSYEPVLLQQRSTTLPSKACLVPCTPTVVNPLVYTPLPSPSIPIEKWKKKTVSPLHFLLNALFFITLYLLTDYPVLSFVYLFVTTSYLIL
ncbi:hypothetical protein [Absidia glauca]|uniref:Phosphodiesterase n=1 Tax=Absidia glauca TaxID=4829 RepID=A0A168LR90_ABSGL|nr:hypothetical protein [Absidia glauca]